MWSSFPEKVVPDIQPLRGHMPSAGHRGQRNAWSQEVLRKGQFSFLQLCRLELSCENGQRDGECKKLCDEEIDSIIIIIIIIIIECLRFARHESKPFTCKNSPKTQGERFSCTCPMASVINHPNHGGLKQHKFIVLQSWRWEVRRGSHWAKIKLLGGLSSFLEALEENPFPCFLASRHHLCFLAHGPFCLQSLQCQPSPFAAISPVLSYLPLLLLKMLMITLGPPWSSRILCLA